MKGSQEMQETPCVLCGAQRAIQTDLARHSDWEVGLARGTKVAKADSTLRCSQAVPHPSTNRALRRLTSEVRRDPVHSTRYGRQRDLPYPACLQTTGKAAVFGYNEEGFWLGRYFGAAKIQMIRDFHCLSRGINFIAHSVLLYVSKVASFLIIVSFTRN